ncbi:MAG: hypothetical protein BGO78_08340 [Chloroflexi bacterium 44-23]|nr:MAG: hypothetical protein BGO78_08340 [Chloroflexi bacterium 44-23]
MSLYYMRSPESFRSRRRRWEQMMNANLEGEQSKVVFPIDVREDEDAYTVYAFLPGIESDDLDIEVVNGTISIKGEIKLERQEGDNYLITERPDGRFCRVVDLPDELDSDNAHADLKNGVLTLRVPKSEVSRPRRIKIANN